MESNASSSMQAIGGTTETRIGRSLRLFALTESLRITAERIHGHKSRRGAV